MTKKELRALCKQNGFTLITKSVYVGTCGTIFNCYNDFGDCYHGYINHEHTFAEMQCMSDVAIHEPYSILDWFR